MKTRYEEMFDEVHASQRLKEEVMNMTKQERTQVVRKISMSFVIAAVLAVLLAGTALAAVIGVPETLQDWFGQKWTEAGGGEEMPKEQSEVIDRLVQPVEVTSIAKGVSITLDSVTPGEGGLWMLLKISGPERKEDRWDFMTFDLSGGPMEQQEQIEVDGSVVVTVSGYSVRNIGVTEDGTQIQLIYYDAPSNVSFLEGGDMVLELGNMFSAKRLESGELDRTEIEGRWLLPFTLEAVGEQKTLTVKSARVSASQWIREEGVKEPTEKKTVIELKDIQVTSTGFAYIHPLETEKYMEDGPELQLADGMVIAGHIGGRRGGEDLIRGSWDIPVDLSKVESIKFGDVVIPLEQSKK